MIEIFKEKRGIRETKWVSKLSNLLFRFHTPLSLYLPPLLALYLCLFLYSSFLLSFLSDTKFATKIIDANLLQNEVVTKRRKKISFRSFNQRLFLLSKSDEGSRQMEKKICFLTLTISKILIRNRLFWAVEELLVNLGFLSKWWQNALKRFTRR